MQKFDIKDRTLDYAILIINLIKCLPRNLTSYLISKQLVRSGTSIGANMEEADGASTRKDFFNKVSISRKEARETRYWLQVVLRSKMTNDPLIILEINKLIDEVSQIIKILSTIINKNCNIESN